MLQQMTLIPAFPRVHPTGKDLVLCLLISTGGHGMGPSACLKFSGPSIGHGQGGWRNLVEWPDTLLH